MGLLIQQHPPLLRAGLPNARQDSGQLLRFTKREATHPGPRKPLGTKPRAVHICDGAASLGNRLCPPSAVVVRGASDEVIKVAEELSGVVPGINKGRISSLSALSLDSPDVGSRRARIRADFWSLAKGRSRYIKVPVYWYGDFTVPARFGTESSLGPFVFAEYEPTEMYWASQFIVPGATVIDLGANDDWYTIFLRELVGDSGRAVSVDANSRSMQHMKCIFKSRSVDNVHFLTTQFGATRPTCF